MAFTENLTLILFGVFFSATLSIGVVFIFLLFGRKMENIQSAHDLELKNKELEMMNAVVHAQEAERKNIARNLHDDVGAILSIAQRNLKLTLNNLPSNSPIKEDIAFSVDVIDQSVEKIRSISHSMLPHFLLKFGLQKSLQRLMEQTVKSLGNPCDFHSAIADELELVEAQEVHFFLIATEIINNLVKHAQPKRIHMNLEVKGNDILLHIEHDGSAIDQSEYENLLNQGHGMGLESISHRVQLIDGKVHFNRHTKGGTIEVSMPFLKKQNIE